MNLWENYKAKTRQVKMKRIILPPSLPPSLPTSSAKKTAPMQAVRGAMSKPPALPRPASRPAVKSGHHPAGSMGAKMASSFAEKMASNFGAGFGTKTASKMASKITSKITPPPFAKPTRIMKKSKKTLPIDGRLDLHGMTADQGLAALDGFFYRMRANRRRHLLIITGKGKGVMKKTLQQFLERQQAIVASHKTANPAHGGDGAYYIVLKKSAVQ